MTDPLNIAIGIATTGRREQLQLTLDQIARQHLLPFCTFVCPASTEDFDEPAARALNIPLRVVHSPRGSCTQRNAILRESADVDVMVFMDDDYYPAPDYLAQVNEIFCTHPDLVVATNRPALDGATGPGVSHDEALRVIAGLAPLPIGGSECTYTYGGYGCNMAVRLAPVREHHVLFDERLPLYGWLEDIDFSRRLARHGQVAQASGLRGVHLATKQGRPRGVRLGYSQIANPIYLVRKGSMTSGYAYSQLLRNVAKNVARSVWPEPWVDRRGRLFGNLLALRDLVSNRLDPASIVNL